MKNQHIPILLELNYYNKFIQLKFVKCLIYGMGYYRTCLRGTSYNKKISNQTDFFVVLFTVKYL